MTGDKTKLKKACGQCCTKIEHLNVTIGRNKVLEDINLHIHCGEFTALVGPNGAGKSTLIKAILGDIPHNGILRFMDSSKRTPDKPRIGYVPQKLDFDTTSPISVMDLFTASISRKPLWFGYNKIIKNKAVEILSLVEAEHLIYRKIGELSGGELQRVLLALALSPVPDLLLLDEPVSGVDLAGIELFYRLVSVFREKYDLSIFLVTHDITGIASVVDRIIFMNHRIICDGPPQEVLENKILQNTFGINKNAITLSSSIHMTKERNCLWEEKK